MRNWPSPNRSAVPDQIYAHEKLERVQLIHAPLKDVFTFFCNPHNLEKLTPTWLNFKITYLSSAEVSQGCQFEYKIRLHLLPLKWRTLISAWKENEFFTDEQMVGPYAIWRHTHSFEAIHEDLTLMKDEVLYRLPFGVLGELIHLLWVKNELKHIFDFRKSAIETVFPQKKEKL